MNPESELNGGGVGDPERPGRGSTFATTRWTLVLAAGGGSSPAATEALEELCRAYWFPLYSHVRRRGHDAHAAQDLTQGFFARLLAREDLARLTREGGRFRSFLLTALNHYLANEHERASAQKRGGDRRIVSLDDEHAEDRYLREPRHSDTPDRAFDRAWAMAVLERAMERLEADQEQAGRGRLFAALRTFLGREPDPGEYTSVGAVLGQAPGTVAVGVHRLRARYREMVRAVVADTVDSPLAVDAELRHLQEILTGGGG